MVFEAEAVQFEEGENVLVYIKSEGAVWFDGRIVEKTGLHWLVAMNDGRVLRFEPRYIRKLNRSATTTTVNIQANPKPLSETDFKTIARELLFRLSAR